MRYILSDGSITTDIDEAVIDALQIQIGLEPYACPYYEGGMNKVVHSISATEIKSEIKSRVDAIVDKVNSKFGVSIVANDLIVNTDGSYSITINYKNNERKIYSRYQLGS